MTRSRWSAAALLIAVFILGALSGGAAAGLTERSTGEWRPRRGGMVEHLAQDLELTSEQQDSIRAILERHKASFRIMRERIGEEISSVLTPQQRIRYEELKTEMRHMRKQGAKDGAKMRGRSQ